jgi:hypothetical protein
MFMDFKRFHHPDISFPVIKHRVDDAILFLLETYTDVILGGRDLLWRHAFPNRPAFCSASYRLRKAGLLAYDAGM